MLNKILSTIGSLSIALCIIYGTYLLRQEEHCVLGTLLLASAISDLIRDKKRYIKWGFSDKNKWHWNEFPSVFERILAILFHVRLIVQDGALYLRRFYLSPRLGFFNKYLFLHHILLSDTDKAYHDHPSDFTTIILKGKYKEHVMLPNGALLSTRECGPGTVLRNKAEHIHRLEIIEPVWSLVIWSKPRREWGFWPLTKPISFIPWFKFLNKDPYYNNYIEDQHCHWNL